MGFSAHATTDASRRFTVKDEEHEGEMLIERKVALMEKTLSRTREKGIKVILCVSPMYMKVSGTSATIELLKKLSEKYDCQFVNAYQWGEFLRNDKYWYDAGHLNAVGAELFTKTLMDSINGND